MKLKKKFLIQILLFVILFSPGCQSKKQDREAITALVINNALTSSTDKNKSLLRLEVADLGGSYTGRCYDTFQLYGGNVSPTTYFNTPAGSSGGALNSNVRKSAVSTSSCSDLGFTSGTNFGSSTQRPNPDDGFTFRLYYCDPNNNPCTKAAMTASGF